MHSNIKKIDSNTKYYYICIMIFIRQSTVECTNITYRKRKHSVSHMHSLEDLTQSIYHRYRKKSVTEVFTQI